MISVITWKLLLVLLAAALLGLLIGSTAMRLHQVRKQKQAYNSQKVAFAKLATQRDSLLDDNASMSQNLEDEKLKSRQTLEQCSLLATQQETLKVHTDLQTQRLEKLSTELHVAEEKGIRLERDFASFRANKLREVTLLKSSSDTWAVEELPVLSKRVGSDSAETMQGSRVNSITASTKDAESALALELELDSDLNATQPIIASELDIPSLAESELPDSVEELEFELTEQDEPI